MRVHMPAAHALWEISENLAEFLHRLVDELFAHGGLIADEEAHIVIPVPWIPAAPDFAHRFHLRLNHLQPQPQLKFALSEHRLKLGINQRVILKQEGSAKASCPHLLHLPARRAGQVNFTALARLVLTDKIDDIEYIFHRLISPFISRRPP